MSRALPLSFKLGSVLTTALIVMACVSFFYTPFDPAHIDIGNRFTPPSYLHFFGTDHLGRDIFSMIMVGARTSVAVAIIAVGIGMAIGVPLGLLAAGQGGVTEGVVMRGNDIVFAFPAIIMAILITAVIGPGAINAIIAVGIFNIPVFAQRGSSGKARPVFLGNIFCLIFSILSLCRRQYNLDWRSLPKRHCPISASARNHRRPAGGVCSMRLKPCLGGRLGFLSFRASRLSSRFWV